MQKRSYRLPDSSHTSDADEYGEAWLKLGHLAEQIFDGFTATQFNPGVLLEKRELYTRHDGVEVYRVVDSISLSPDVIMMLARKYLNK